MLADTLRFAGHVLRGLIAAAVLVALVAGLPWALWHYIGWPLPHHMPTGNQVRAVVLAPMTPTLLLDMLAVACWIAWAAFALDVARATVDAARGGRWPEASRPGVGTSAGPLRTVAAVLIGTVVLTLLGQRTATANTTSSAGLSEAVSGHTPVVATAVWHRPSPDHVHGTSTATTQAPPVPVAVPSATALTTVVRAPDNGVHDSLYRLARDTLDDPNRWPEIFALNQGAPQPDGHRLTVPSLIYPGEELRLPPGAHPYAPASLAAPARPAGGASSASSPSARGTMPPASTAPVTFAPGVPTPRTAPTRPAGRSPAPPSDRHAGLQLGTEIFLGLGLATSISAALMLARHRYRRDYRPGSGRRDDLPVAPVVYQLRLAHLRATRDEADDCDDDPSGHQISGTPPAGTREPVAPVVITSRRQADGEPIGDPGATAPHVGVRDGRDLALDLASTHGLGVVGDGAPAAARALLLALLAPPPPPRTSGTTSAHPHSARVFVPATDLAELLGSAHPADLPDTVHVAPNLDTALDQVETEILRRTRQCQQRADTGTPSQPGTTGEVEWPPIAIVTTPPAHAPQRLQAVLDNGGTVGVVGVLLGQWRPGVTALVTADGRVPATGPGLGESLRGTRVFRLPEPDAADLLALLRLAQPQPHHTAADSTGPAVRTGRAPPGHAPTMPGSGSPSDAGAGSAAGDGALEVTTVATDGLEITGAPPAGDPSPRSGAFGPPGTAPPERRPEDRRAHTSSSGAADPAGDQQPADDGSAAPEDQPDPQTAGTPPAPAPEPPAARVTPVREDLDSAADTTGTSLATDGDTPTDMPLPISLPISLTVLGPVRMHWHRSDRPDTASDATGRGPNIREITGSLGPRQRELVVFLAVHRTGVTRDALVAALWPDGRPDRPTNALNAILSRLRRALATATDRAVSEILLTGDGRYQLDPALVDVDLWHFADAVAAQRSATTQADRVAAYRRVVGAYGGKLADGIDAEWLEAEADATRRDAIDAVAALARAIVEHDPTQTLELLETARTRDPYNELLYRDIMRLQDRLGRHDAIGRTLTQLTKRLAEINDKPSRQAVELATRLQARASAAR